MNKVQQAAMDWEAKAIEECKKDPSIAAMGMCPVCMTFIPCLCDKEQAVRAMRKYHDEFQRNPVKRTGSWGIPVDVLMEELHKIATARHEEINKIRINQTK